VLDQLSRDVRGALRAASRNRFVTIVLVGVLALGLGANTAVFGVVYATLLRPIAYPDAGELVVVTAGFPSLRLQNMGLAGAEVEEFSQLTQAFQATAAMRFAPVVVSDGRQPRELRGAHVSSSLFDTLQTQPIQGRAFAAGEDSADAPVAIVSFAIWQSLLGGTAGVIGQPLQIDGVARTVVGVMPAGFTLMDQDVAVLLPLKVESAGIRGRGNHSYTLIARMKSGTTLEAARADVARALDRWESATGQFMVPSRAFHPLTVTSLSERVTEGKGRPLTILVCAVAFVLLLACANVAYALIAHTQSRAAEMRIRIAMGARLRHLGRQLATEGLLLASVAGAIGLGVSVAIWKVLAAYAPPALSIRSSAPGLETLVFVGVAAVVAGLVVSLAPLATAVADTRSASIGSMHVSRTDAHPVTKHLIIVVQVAASVAMLAGFAVMLRTVKNLSAVDPGVRAEGVVTMTVSLPPAQYASSASVSNFFDRLEHESLAMPGVESVAAASGLPPVRPPNNTTISVEGFVPGSHDAVPHVDFIQLITPQYFKVLGVPILQGRSLAATDSETGLPVAVVNQTMAQRLWPDGRVLGRRFRSALPGSPWITVIGVAGDVKQRGLDRDVGTEVFVPYRQSRNIFAEFVPRTLNVVARLRGPASSAPDLTAAVASVDQSLVRPELRTLQSHLDGSIGGSRFLSGTLGVFGAAALLLTLTGVYGAMTHTMIVRRRELAIRTAIGADGVQLVTQTMRPMLALVLIGVIGGSGAALWAIRMLGAALYEVPANDPTAIITSSLIVAVAAALALYVPAMRSATANPLPALSER
jgi:predicted permease